MVSFRIQKKFQILFNNSQFAQFTTKRKNKESQVDRGQKNEQNSFLFQNIPHGFFIWFCMQMLSLDIWTLLLAFESLICDFGPARLEFWSFTLSFAFSHRHIVGGGFGGLIAITEGFFMIEGETHDILPDGFEMSKNGINFGIFGFFIHDLEHISVAIIFVLFFLCIETDFNLSLQSFILLIIKDIQSTVSERKDYLNFYQISCLKSSIYSWAGSRLYSQTTFRREALELRRQEEEFWVWKAKEEARDQRSLMNYMVLVNIWFVYLNLIWFVLYKTNQFKSSSFQYNLINLHFNIPNLSSLTIIIKSMLKKQQQNQPESQFHLISLVDNLDFKQELQLNQYIVLIKKQPEKNYSTLYLTDCQDNFWLKKIDLKFIEELKNELKLKTSTLKFIECLMKGLKDSCSIILPDSDSIKSSSSHYPHLQIKLEIGQGLTMTSQIILNRNLNREQDEQGHKIILKLFLTQLYESKESKQTALHKLLEQIKKQKQEDDKSEVHSKKDSKFSKELFSVSEQKKDPNKNLKNRDLLNPNRQKRKNAGVKLATPN